MNETLHPTLGFAHYWAQGDAVTHSVAYLLLLMSVISWYYILSKAWASWRIRKSAEAVERFWDAPSMDDAISLLNHADTERVYAPLATHAVEAVNVKANSSSLNANIDPGELVTRTLRQQINRVSSRLESGLTLLASVGSTNFDNRSFRLNEEANLNVYDKAFAERLEDVFEQDLEQSRRITYQSWKNRPWYVKAMEEFSSSFASQL